MAALGGPTGEFLVFFFGKGIGWRVFAIYLCMAEAQLLEGIAGDHDELPGIGKAPCMVGRPIWVETWAKQPRLSRVRPVPQT
jgi:hypothetical protein